MEEASTEVAAAREVAEAIKGDYLMVRVLDDNSVAAIGDLLFTRALYLGCEVYGWTRRFCFEDRALALDRFFELQSEDDEPQGYVAKR